MKHAFRVVPGGMDSGMDHETGRVDDMIGVRNDISVQVDLDQAGGGNFAEMHAIGVEQEMLRGARRTGRNMGGKKIVHAEMGDQPIAGGEIDPHVPFRVRHRRVHICEFSYYRAGAHSLPPELAMIVYNQL
jgi:hypothetical protein